MLINFFLFLKMNLTNEEMYCLYIFVTGVDPENMRFDFDKIDIDEKYINEDGSLTHLGKFKAHGVLAEMYGLLTY